MEPGSTKLEATLGEFPAKSRRKTRKRVVEIQKPDFYVGIFHVCTRLLVTPNAVSQTGRKLVSK